jgi:hypothetical protein
MTPAATAGTIRAERALEQKTCGEHDAPDKHDAKGP